VGFSPGLSKPFLKWGCGRVCKFKSKCDRASPPSASSLNSPVFQCVLVHPGEGLVMWVGLPVVVAGRGKKCVCVQRRGGRGGGTLQRKGLGWFFFLLGFRYNILRQLDTLTLHQLQHLKALFTKQQCQSPENLIVYVSWNTLKKQKAADCTLQPSWEVCLGLAETVFNNAGTLKMDMLQSRAKLSRIPQISDFNHVLSLSRALYIAGCELPGARWLPYQSEECGSNWSSSGATGTMREALRGARAH